MTAGSTDRRATRRVAREEGAAGAVRREPRELYEAGPPAASGNAAVEPTPRDAPFRGEFEQRARGADGTGPPGSVGSDSSTREQICQRIADDPRLAGTQVDVAVDSGVLTISGTVADAGVRDLILEHARRLGVAGVRDALHIDTVAP